jgi:hypothetical protein
VLASLLAGAVLFGVIWRDIGYLAAAPAVSIALPMVFLLETEVGRRRYRGGYGCRECGPFTMLR